MPSFLIFLATFLGFSQFSSALDCRNGETGAPISMDSIISAVKPGGTLFLGELHGFKDVADGQVQILEALRNRGHKVDVAFEFFPYTKQTEVDQFVQGLIPEVDFLASIGWGKGLDFGFYRAQALFSRHLAGERTLAINAPRSLTGAVAKRGLVGLTDEEKSLLPPDLELGRAEYFDRFRELMGGHADEKTLVRYFEAQSVWDDTMAWQLTGHRSGNTKVVVVGEFHVQYGGGLPHRLSVRNPQAEIVTIGFLNIHDLTAEELRSQLRPHQNWGSRENFICLVDLPISVWVLPLKEFGDSFR